MIGAGAGGLTVALGLAAFGRRVALVEAGRVGGDCTNTGCIPSKRLIHLSRSHTGWDQSTRILADVRATRDGLSRQETTELEHTSGVEFVRGSARFTSRSTVSVEGPDGEQPLRAARIVIATGSRASDIDIPGLPADRHLTNENLFELDAAPGHLTIVGAGAISLEMAGAFTRMGTQVTLIDVADRVLPHALRGASATLERALREEGVDIRLETRVRSYDARGGVLHVEGPAGDDQVHGVDAVLVAVGRVPNVDSLNLAVVGLAADRDGIAVDSWGRTSTRGIWAVGDVTQGSHQTHAANALGRRAVQRIGLPWLPPVGRPPVIASAVFCEPEVAWVGLSQAELSRRYSSRVVRHVRVEFADLDRGLTDGVRHGFIAVDAIRLTGRILSATVVGPGSSELIALVTLAISRGVSLFKLSRLAYTYPTFAGAIGRVADEFARGTLTNLRTEITTYATHRFGRGDRSRRA